MDIKNTSGRTSAGAVSAFVRRAWPDAVCVVFFLLLAYAYFAQPLSEGLVLGGHDSVAAVGQGREQTEYGRAHGGETSRWTNTLFSGMPTYQTSPSYGSSHVLNVVQNVFSLGTTGALSYVFLYLLGFYILLRALRLRPWLAALGAVAWAFSSYFFIIIAAGHIWKVLALCFVPPTIGGLVLCYRGRYLWGGAVTALFTALQVHANHVQMTYYFLFLMAFIAVAYGVAAFARRGKKMPVGTPGGAADTVGEIEGAGLTPRRWLAGTLVALVAGLAGTATNVSNLYHTYAYTRYSLRGPAELSPQDAAAKKQATQGLDRDYITQWSYGVDETLTLLVPDFKGGGSTTSVLDRDDAEKLPGYEDIYRCAATAHEAMQQGGAQGRLPGLVQYWGDQPMTVGPVYVGAFICFLFLLGLFYVRGPLKWALLAGTVLSLLFAWGHNDAWFTNFCIDHLPFYSKFRTPSSALVVAELCMPLLGILALAKVMQRPGELLASRRGRVSLLAATLLTAGTCLVLWLWPGAAGDCLSQADHETLGQLTPALGAQFTAQYADAITQMHHAILSASAGRSLLVILLGLACLGVYVKIAGARGGKGNTLAAQVGLAAALLVLCLVDLWTVDSRYLVTDSEAPNASFTEPATLQEVQPTEADKVVLADKGDYRVVNLSEGNPFNETSNHTAYFFQSIGGYNAAKLHRYQDLIDRVLMPELQAYVIAINEAEGQMQRVPGDSLAPMLNALNAKYLIFGQHANQVVRNPYAAGNGWFVRELRFVEGADAEMAATQQLQPKQAAVADAAYRTALSGTALDSGTVRLTRREANRVEYDVETRRGGVAVLSEVFYPGWSCTVDGKETAVGRVDYVLRAVRVAPGKHHVVMTYQPRSVRRTEAVAYCALALVLAGFLLALVLPLVRTARRRKTLE